MAEMIRELVPCSEEIALPGLGVFVVEEVPATFSDRGYTVNPPYLRLAFRQKSSEDNSLVNLYAKRNPFHRKRRQPSWAAFSSAWLPCSKTRKASTSLEWDA